MRTINTCVLTLLTVLFIASTSFSAVTIDFEGLGVEGAPLTSLFVTDPNTGESVTVNFFVFNGGGITGRPILVEEGIQGGIQGAFFPMDTPAGEVPGNGNDWMLGNGIGVADNYLFTFTGNAVRDISLDLIDFRSDGPVSAGMPGSDTATLRTFDGMGQFPVFAPSIYTVPVALPVDGAVVSLSSNAVGVTEARLVFTPPGVDAGVAIDNLRFTVIPEPGAGSLLGLAMVLCGLIRRK